MSQPVGVVVSPTSVASAAASAKDVGSGKAQRSSTLIQASGRGSRDARGCRQSSARAIFGHLFRPLLSVSQAAAPAAVLTSAAAASVASALAPDAAQAVPDVAILVDTSLPAELGVLAEGLETPVNLIYLAVLLTIVVGSAFAVVRAALVRRELDEAAKELGERVRTGRASCEDHYELGCVLMRKRLFTQAVKQIRRAVEVWDGDESELAQAHNALGFAYFSMDLTDDAVREYQRAVELLPGYATGWNNLGDALEAKKQWAEALAAYNETLALDPGNAVALDRQRAMMVRVERTAELTSR